MEQEAIDDGEYEQTVSANLLTVISILMNFLDCGSNKNNVEAWKRLSSALEKLMNEENEENERKLMDIWMERADFWDSLHLKYESKELDEEVKKLKRCVIAGLRELEK